MHVLDLFSGIGGFTLGFEQAGLQTVGFCEIDPFCRAVLHKHWPHIPIHTDISVLDGLPYRGAVDVICGGYPCQPFSVAGIRQGADDQRHLWPEMYRLVREIRPRWVVAENVAGHIDLGFDEVASSLETEDFTVWSFVIPASALGASHRRDRLWIIAHADRERLQGSGGQLQKDQRARAQLPPLLPSFSSQTYRPHQLSPSFLCRRADGISHRTHRLRALGNAIVPQIAEIIGHSLVDYEAALQIKGDVDP